MADAGVLGATRGERVLERVKFGAGVLAAVVGAVTGLFTVYEKVRSDARQYTATSYETLAPQVNQMTEALTQHAASPRTAARTAPARSASHPAAAAAPAQTASVQPAEEEKPDDRLGEIVGTIKRTRDAVDTLRKVPDTFDRVLQQKK
jgi:hypothetical protein